MLANYLDRGFSTFFYGIILAIVMIPLFLGVKILLGKKNSITPLNTIAEVAWVAIVLSILSITGILGGQFGTTSLIEGTAVISFDFLAEGLSMATILNIILFIPFGFLSAIVFKRSQTKWIYGILIGLLFTSLIEFLQTFTGRFVQIDDIIMNTLGTYLGYTLCIYGLKFKPLKPLKRITD